MANFPEKIENLIHGDYNFRFGDYISESFNLVKKEAGLFMAFALVMMLISTGLSFIPVIGSLVSWLIISPCLMAGFFLALDKVNANEKLQFGDLFKGFDYMSKLIVVMLFQMLLTFICFIPIGILGYVFFDMFLGATVGAGPIVALVVLLLLAPFFYLMVSWSWAILFVIFYDMEAWPALEASRKLISKHWFLFFAYLIVGMLLMMAGAVVFLIGLLFTIPVFYAMLYVSFKDVTQLKETLEDDITKHLVV